VIDRQQPSLKVQPRMMLIDDADRQARWIFSVESSISGVATNGRADGPPLMVL